MSLTHSTPSIITDGLVLCLDAANRRSYPGSGTVWYDISPNKNHGTLTNGPIYSAINNGAISFDGIDDCVIITNNNLKVAFSEMTINIWFKRASHSSYKNVIERSTWNNNDGYAIYTNDGKIEWGHFPDKAVSTISVCDNTIKNICCTFNTSNLATIYINGILNISQTLDRTIEVSTHNLGIFRRILAGGYEAEGTIFSLQMYNRSLSSLEVSQNFNALRRRFGI